MPIDIGNINLTKIHRINTVENSNFVYHDVPGLDGNISQDLGRESVKLVIEGIFFGPTASDDLTGLRDIYKNRQPVDFVADIAPQSYVGRVVVDSFNVKQDANDPEQFSYLLVVSEYVNPPSTGMSLDSVNAIIDMEAAALMDLAALPDMIAIGSMPEISNPVEPLNNALEPVKEAVDGLSDSLSGLTKLFGE